MAGTVGTINDVASALMRSRCTVLIWYKQASLAVNPSSYAAVLLVEGKVQCWHDIFAMSVPFVPPICNHTIFTRSGIIIL